MDGKRTTSVFLSINLLSFILSISISSSIQTQTQTLFITPLSKPKTFTQTDSQTQTQTQTIHTNQTHHLSLDLHHIDSHPSMSTLSSKSLFDLFLKRDRLRVIALSAAVAKKKNSHGISSSVVSGASLGIGEYFTRVGFGTPTKKMDLILDTGSDIIWIQCAPCKKCYKQSVPLFAPKKSISSSPVSCGSNNCPTPCSNGQTCHYRVDYGDGSFTVGDYMTETLTFRRKKLKNIHYGCGYDNEGLFVGAAGLLGLGRGKLSFTSQVGSRFNNAFSYCLVGRNSNAKSSIMFGDKALSRKGVYTPLLTNPALEFKTFYYAALEGMSVEGETVHIPEGVLKMDETTGDGGVIIDSGTSVTRLPKLAYEALRDAFRKKTKKLRRSSAVSIFDTCYDFSGLTRVNVPVVALLFEGAEMVLPTENYLISVDDAGTTYCFAFASTSIGLSIIGNIQQQGFRVSYDLANKRIGFTPNSCGSD